MKDRIREIMESQHMNQQSFAAFIGIAPASLSSMLQERTRPTLNTVEAIMAKMPQINLKWLISGDGNMFQDLPGTDTEDLKQSQVAAKHQEQSIDFDIPTPISSQPISQKQSTRNSESNQTVLHVKNIDKKQRLITEIRVFYDDQTWESFVPKTKM